MYLEFFFLLSPKGQGVCWHGIGGWNQLEIHQEKSLEKVDRYDESSHVWRNPPIFHGEIMKS